jgi:peptidoglycan/LPS O-acetylase OafA/YrhL
MISWSNLTLAARFRSIQYANEFDGLRAVAVLLVVGFHAWADAVPGGFIGVDVFFVLSGYLVTGIILADPAFRYGAFMARRARRLLPALVLFLLTFAAVAPFVVPRVLVWPEILIPLSGAANYIRIASDLPYFTPHTWSLAIEAQFYLVWPAVVIALRDKPGWVVATALGSLWAASTLWRAACFDLFGWVYAYHATGTRLSGLVIGAAVAFFPRATLPPMIRGPAFAAIFFLALTGHYYDTRGALLSGPGTEIMTAALILSPRGAGLVSSVLTWPPLVRLGLWSYGIYLWHFPVAHFVRNLMPGPARLALTLAIAIPLAALSFEFFERRFTLGRKTPLPAKPVQAV